MNLHGKGILLSKIRLSYLALAGCYPVMEETRNNDEGNPNKEGNDPNTKEENYDTQWEVHKSTAHEECYSEYWKRNQIIKLIIECYFV